MGDRVVASASPRAGGMVVRVVTNDPDDVYDWAVVPLVTAHYAPTSRRDAIRSGDWWCWVTPEGEAWDGETIKVAQGRKNLHWYHENNLRPAPPPGEAGYL